VNELNETAVQARRREIATEHVLFWLVKYLEERSPGLVTYIEGSLDHLGDPAQDGTKDNEAVREIAAPHAARCRSG
jgi:hypothetical protein